MVTSLSCLSLEVYDRYLRVYKPAEAGAKPAPGKEPAKELGHR